MRWEGGGTLKQKQNNLFLCNQSTSQSVRHVQAPASGRAEERHGEPGCRLVYAAESAEGGGWGGAIVRSRPFRRERR